ncbi:vanadium-dependent haloperoxidase [Planctomonas deserti]|uniref:vanadium-dependent haloperoxidase n=1 Tax=Planctomonas deserti TaxID=2144185 RepID=UPI000D39CFFE|nr:vanadium-dependent haloperoxidase [Planctomonas deserti]
MLTKSAAVPALALAATVGLLAPAALAEPAGESRSSRSDASVITEWNTIAERTIYAENATPIPSSSLYFGFVSIAMYDAVVAIEGGYTTYTPQPPAHRRASSRVAAATAAYLVLSYFFPASAPTLQEDYLKALSGERRKGRALVGGVAAGAAAASGILRARQNDGIGNPDILFDTEPVPGVWRPTAPQTTFAVPWLGFVRPLVIESATQFPQPDPNPLGSAAYATEFEETRTYGGADGTEGLKRTVEETATAMFFSVNVSAQYQAGMRDQVTRRGLGIVESARAFAILNTSVADTLISCWRAKYEHPTWRPVTAIREADTDGNDATMADATWSPLGVTPPYPEYSSGHACYTGAASNTFDHLFGDGQLNLILPSLTDPATSREYDSAEALDTDAMNARIWLGLHFRSSMTGANQLGHSVSDWVIAHSFRPVG